MVDLGIGSPGGAEVGQRFIHDVEDGAEAGILDIQPGGIENMLAGAAVISAADNDPVGRAEGGKQLAGLTGKGQGSIR